MENSTGVMGSGCTTEGYECLADESVTEFAQMYLKTTEEVFAEAERKGKTVVELITEYTKIELQNI